MRSSRSKKKPDVRKPEVGSEITRTARRQFSWVALFICIALVIAVFGVYAPASHFNFVNYDDPDYVTRNPHVSQGLTADSIRWAITSGDAANWFPVTRLSHIFDYQLFDLDSGAHHLMNVAFHACAALLLFLFLERATACRWPSAAVAFLFALHPLHVESVAWIAERKDTLSALFWFLTLWLYVWYAERPGRLRYALVLLSFCLDLMSKPMAVTLPIVLLLLDYWPLKRKGAWLEKVPLFALAAASAVITFAVQQSSGAVKTLATFPLPLRIENALVSYGVYLAKTFWPSRLAVFYPFPADIPIWKPIVAVLVIGAMSLLVWRLRVRQPYLIVGWLWFLITLLPVIGIVQVGVQSRADRYMYLPMTGLLIMLAWGALHLILWKPGLKWAAFALAGIVCAASATAATWQLATWQNSGTLFEHALAVTQRNDIAEHNLGTYLLDVPGQLPTAIAHLQKALEINPASVSAHSDLGIALAKSGHIPEAIREFKTALQLDPSAQQPRQNLEAARAQQQSADSAEAHYNRGVELMKSKNMLEAIQEFAVAISRNPNYAEAHNDLGVAYSSSGHLSQAITQFEAAVRINPNYVDAQYNLGAALSQIPGRTADAISQFEIVERLRPDPNVEQIIRQLRGQNSTR
ncbi:MAG TPA: tetratricopeptide repeat protein [Bryobacteraceae bacterium]|nr:tetratricopeptide repeat protein [Bryobacteraceae bacterium]